LALAALACYWLVIFASTHYPHTGHVRQGHMDKLYHFLAYSGLGFLLTLVYGRLRGYTWSVALAAVGAVAFYGALDELTQQWVGRDCELLDWLADLAGGVVGAGLVLALAWITGRRAPSAIAPREWNGKPRAGSTW
jgi:VanZ family protein